MMYFIPPSFLLNYSATKACSPELFPGLLQSELLLRKPRTLSLEITTCRLLPVVVIPVGPHPVLARHRTQVVRPDCEHARCISRACCVDQPWRIVSVYHGEPVGWLTVDLIPGTVHVVRENKHHHTHSHHSFAEHPHKNPESESRQSQDHHRPHDQEVQKLEKQLHLTPRISWRAQHRTPSVPKERTTRNQSCTDTGSYSKTPRNMLQSPICHNEYSQQFSS